MTSDTTPSRTRAAFRAHPRAVTLASILLLVVVQQLVASLWYAAQYQSLIRDRIMPTKWDFWFHWNDYWIFMKYLDWPGRNGTAIAADAQLVGAIVVAVAFICWLGWKR